MIGIILSMRASNRPFFRRSCTCARTGISAFCTISTIFLVNLCAILPIDIFQKVWYNVNIKEREVITMISVLIMLSLGFCFLGLLICGIILFIDTLRAKKFAKEIQIAFESFRKTELNKPFYNYKDDNSIEFNFYFQIRYNFNNFGNSVWYIERM